MCERKTPMTIRAAEGQERPVYRSSSNTPAKTPPVIPMTLYYKATFKGLRRRAQNYAHIVQATPTQYHRYKHATLSDYSHSSFTNTASARLTTPMI